MSEEQSSPASPVGPEASPSRGPVRRFFRSTFWPAGVVRVLLYAVLFAAFFACIGRLVQFFHPWTLRLLTPSQFFVAEAVSLAAALLAALAMSFFEKTRPGVYGLPLRAAFGKLFWQGILAGLLEVTALIGLIAAFGGYSFGSLAIHGSELMRWLIFWAVFFLLVGLNEEFLFRGYVQSTLGSGTGFWLAALILSAGFGAVHLPNPGEGWVGALSIFVVGLFLCLTLRRTGNLWFAVGVHASFDFGETFLYSVPNSGFVAEGHLSNASLHGPAWLTGGTIGPEGSVFSFLTIGILSYAIHRLYPAKTGASGSV